MLSVPHRAQDNKFTSSIEGYRGSIYKLGRLLAHDWFSVNSGDLVKERYLFLFKARILICKVRRISEERSVFQLKDIIRLPQVDVKDHISDDSTFELIEKGTGQIIILTAHRENVKAFWLREVREFAGEADESVSDDLQVTSEPTSPPTEPAEVEKEPQKPTVKVEEPPIKVPKVEVVEEPPTKLLKVEERKEKVDKKVEEVSIEVSKVQKVEEPPAKVQKVEEPLTKLQKVEEPIAKVQKVEEPPAKIQKVEESPTKVIKAEAKGSEKAEEAPAKVIRSETKGSEKAEEAPAKVIRSETKGPEKEESPKSPTKVEEKPKVKEPIPPKETQSPPAVEKVALKSNPKPEDTKVEKPIEVEKKLKETSKPIEVKTQEKLVETPKQRTDNPKAVIPRNPKAETSKVEVKSDSSLIAQQTQSVALEKTSTRSQVSVLSKQQKIVTAESRADEVDHYKIGIQVGLKTEGLDIDDDMSRKYTEYTTSSSARSGGYEDTSYGRRSASKSSYSTEGYASSKYGGDISSSRRSAESALTSKYGTDSLSSKYSTDSITSKYGGESLKYGTDTLASKYSAEALTSKYGSDTLTSRYGNDSVGGKYGVETTKYGVEGNTKYEITSKHSKGDIEGGSRTETSYTKRALTDTGDGDTYASYSRKSIRTQVRSEDDGDLDYKRNKNRISITDAGDDDYSSYTRRSIRESKLEDDGDHHTRLNRRKPKSTDEIEEYSYKRTGEDLGYDDAGIYVSRRRKKVETDDGDIDQYVAQQKSLDEDLDPSAYLSKRRSLKSEESEDVQSRTTARQDSDKGDYKRLTSVEEEDRLAKFEKYSRRSAELAEKRESSSVSTSDKTDIEFVKTVTETAHIDADSLALRMKTRKEITSPPDERPLFTKTLTGQTVEPTEEELHKPHFAVQLKDTELLEDTYLRFMIKVKGDPHPEITFFKNGVRISDTDERTRVIKDHENIGFYELVIPDVKPSDAGLYRCVAVNNYGEASTEARLTVTENKIVFDDANHKEGILPAGEKPDFTWRKDGKDFDPEERFKVLMGDDEDSLALIFQHVRPEDAGLYTCVAQTSTGHISCSAELTVQGTVVELHREPEKPQLIIEHREAIATIGGSAMLELQVKGFPKPKVKLSKEGQQIEPSSKYKFLYEDEESLSIIIKNVEASDAGKYEFTAENELGQDIREMTLNVKAPPKIKSKLEDVSINIEETLRLSVEVEGIPKPYVQFYKDGKEIRSSDRIKVVEEGDSYTLVVEKTILKDSGSYSVVASNEIAQVSQFCNVYVYTKPRILKKLGTDIIVSQSEDVELSIKFESEPAPEVQWYKGDKEITSDSHYVIRQDGDTYILKISGAVTTDSSSYKCKAKNIHGSVDDEARVYVRCAPKILKPLDDMTVTEYDKNVTFDVKVEAYPKPTVKWYLDEMEISETRTEFTRIESDDGAKLVIKEVTSELSGQYSCKLVNDLGATETSAKLTVNCKPRIIKHLKDTTVEEGATLHLEVEVEGCPEPTVKWLRNGNDVSADARIKITRDLHRQESYSLTVNLIKYEEEGEYEVEVTNMLGTITSKSYVTVQKITHTDAIEETEEPPKKLIVEVVEDEKQVAVEDEGVRIEEIIEESPPDQGDKDFIIEEIKEVGKASKLSQKEEIGKVENGFEYESKSLIIEEVSVKHEKGKSIQVEQSIAVDFEGKSSKIEEVLLKRKPSKGKSFLIEEIEISGSPDEPQTPTEVLVGDKPRKSVSAFKEEIIEDDFEIPKRRESKIEIIDGVAQKGVSAIKEEIVEVDQETPDSKRKQSKVELIEDKTQKGISATKEDITPTENELRKLKREESKIEDVPKDEAQKAKLAVKAEAVDVENEAKRSARKPSKTSIQEETPQKGLRTPEEEIDEEVEALLRKAQKQRSLIEEIKMQELDEGPEALPVITDTNMKDKSQYESLGVTYVVKGKANPPPTATWTVDGKPITTSTPRCSISQRGEEFKLEVKKLKMEDAGVYQCVLSNPVGEAKTQAKLDIIPEGEFRRPKVKDGLESQTIIKKNTVIMKAVIIGDPVPDATWYFDGKPISEEDFEKYKIILETEDREITDDLKECTYTLTIPRCERENEGKYTIKAKNKWGVAESSAELTIVLKPEIKGPEDIKVVPGNSGELKVVVQARPTPTVIWTRNENVVEATEDIEIIEDVNAETYILRFKDVKLGDEGYYKVTAKNDLGEDNSEGRLRVLKEPEPMTEKPKFITCLADALVEHGNEITLMVRADGLPRPVLTWYLNNKPIEEAPELKTVANTESQITSYLTITDYNLKDSGYYKVTAVNVVGDAETSAKITMVQTPPAFTLRLIRNMDINEGEPLELKAKITGSPKPSIKWYKDGEEIPPDDNRIKIEVSPDGIIKLQIDEVKPSDSGAYKLVVKNPNGETAGLCAVIVTPTPQRPKFTKCLKDQKLTIGEPLRLEAYVTAYPPPEIKWFKDGLPIRPSSNVHIEHHPDGKIALAIDTVKGEHAGKYSVVASNKLGDITGEAIVTTERRPSRPDFSARLFPQNVVEGFPVKMEVKATGYPTPKVTWYRNDAEVVPDPQHIKITNLPDGTSILVIDSCDRNVDALVYKAVASNEAGDVETSAPLTVSPASKENQPEERPMFLHSLKDIITDEGQELKLEVPFTGNPIPSVQWVKDGQPVTPSDRILLTCDGRKVGLLIDKAVPSDAGQYGVSILNPLGKDTTEAKAIVHKVFAPPKFTQRFTDLQQLPSRDAKFLARVSGVPQPEIKWYKDGQELHETDKYRIKRDGDVCCLYVNNSDVDDQGVYRAIAANKEGEDRCEAKLDIVKEIKTPQKVEAPYFLKRLGDTELYKGMTAKFTACAAGTPEPEVVWYRNDEKLFQSERIRMEKDTAGLLRLTIAGVDQDDVGKYSCKIFNDYGQDICHAELRFDETDAKPKRPMVDQYVDYDKYKKSGAPLPLSDAPIISRMSDRRCTLSWKPSISPTPRAPVTYQLEMLEMPHGDWFTVRSGIRGCVCDVGNLEPFRDYKFRIRVENKYGISDPSPFAVTHREKLEPDLPKFVPYLPPGIDFRPETSPYFPKDFDIDRPPHGIMAQAPRFLRREDDMSYGVKDQNTNLFWFVYGYPKPKVTFYFNDEPVESGGRFSTSYTRNGQATLFINKMLERDVGWYEAVASNEHGEARQRVRLEIAEAPIFLKRPDIEYVMVRGKARFEARIIGVPYPNVKWYKDWKPLATSSRTKIQFIEPDTHILIINDVILKDDGLYSVSARNVAGTISASAMLHIEENDLEYNIRTYRNLSPIKIKRAPLDSGYDLGDELGRGTQGVTYHGVERINGRNYAAKVMHGRGDLRPFMYNELEMLNQLRHRKLISLHDAYETDDTLALILELGGGGELVKDYLLKQDYYTESEIAGYIRQLLQGLQYMHEKGIGHMGLNIGDLLLSHPGSDDLKITDFSLSRRISMGRLYPLKYGVPEYVSPECAKGEGVGLPHDMWSVGIITYILLSGISPFRGERDKETLIKIQEGKWNFEETWWRNISVEARDFITKLLFYQAEGRMDVHAALRHPWLEKADKTWRDEFRISSRFLRDYFVFYREWYDNASCRNWFRRRPLEGAFTHPSRMVYPPNERYTPPPTRPTPERTPRKAPTWEDQIPSRSPLNYEIGIIKSESHYQSGPDTYLLQLRDVDFPVRIREYMKVAANRGPGAGYIVSDENGFDWRTPVIRERRRFTDIMDEEIDDERKARITKYGSGDTGYSIRRLRHEIGARLDTYAEAEAFLESKHEGRLPFFREKPQMEALQEGKDLELSCFAVGDPMPIVQWFKSDTIVAESHRIKIETDEEGRSHLKFAPALNFDMGLYKVVARNKIGQTVARTRIVMGLVPDEPDSPEATQASSTEALLTWKQPKFDGHSPVQCYGLQYKKANETEWTEQASNIDHEFYLMTGLQPSESYVFRLRAKNSIGWSEPGVASMVVVTKPPGASKIQLSKAMAHLQQITDSGQEPQTDPYSKPNYKLEVDPVDWIEENPQSHYEFISEISRGRYSAVLKAIDKRNDSIVVVKLLEMGDNKEQVDGEFAALRSLRHDRIAGLVAAYRTNESPVAAFILEKLQGADVLTYLSSRHEYTEQTVATIVTQVLDGLQYLHWRGLCHLDLQPDNVVMSGVRSVQVKLVDLGCAHRVTKLGNRVPIIGHPDYMAPEVLAEEPAFPLTDIWSLGVLMYVMLSGTLPFRGADETESRQNILFVRYRFENLFQEVSQEGIRFLMLVFKRHPNKRPTAEECHENRWLLPTDYMIKKRERAVFLGNRLKEYNEQYHAGKQEEIQNAIEASGLTRGMMRSHSITEELLTAP